MDLASPGVFASRRDVSADSAHVIVRAEIENHTAMPREVDVGSSRSSTRTPGALGADSTSQDAPGAERIRGGRQAACHDHRPHLWDARADPYLYTVRVELRPVSADGSAGRPFGRGRAAAGTPVLQRRPPQGLHPERCHLDLYGFNRHQDWPDKGWAISDAEEAEDFEIMMESGATAVRVSHYQQSDSWYALRPAGIVAWAEIPLA
jgi:beta-galactosidase